jgi:hypothetical protein
VRLADEEARKRSTNLTAGTASPSAYVIDSDKAREALVHVILMMTVEERVPWIALSAIDKIHIERPDSMVDFEKWSMAAAPAFGCSRKSFGLPIVGTRLSLSTTRCGGRRDQGFHRTETSGWMGGQANCVTTSSMR